MSHFGWQYRKQHCVKANEWIQTQIKKYKNDNFYSLKFIESGMKKSIKIMLDFDKNDYYYFLQSVICNCQNNKCKGCQFMIEFTWY